jgi:predicted GIY-YIG superfamily endonuclease
MSAVDLEALQQMTEMHAVYRMLDRAGHLLYVGMTGDVGTRFGNHAAKRWFPQVETIKLEWHASKAAARAAEQRAIRTERPRHNILEARSAPPRKPRTLTLDELGAEVTLAQAVGARVVTGTLAAVRQARTRDKGFPRPVGRDGTALLYGPAALAEWEASR